MYSTVCLVILSLFFSPSLCAECSHEPLGMEDGRIRDIQIRASSEYDDNHGAENGRLNRQASGGRTGGWAAGTINVNQWLQVDLRGQADISEIKTQGRDCCDQFVKTYTVSYSNDGTTFTDYKDQSPSASVKVFTGNADIVSVVSNVLSPAINARYIRVHPKSWNVFISMRIELVGCRTEMDSDTCSGVKLLGFCTLPYFKVHCSKACPSAACYNTLPEVGCSFIKQNGGCKDFFPICRKTCKKCDVLYESVGCFTDKNGDRIMDTILHIDYADPNIVNDCSQRAANRGYSVFGVEAGGQCFSGPSAGLTFTKHGQAAHGDCIDGKGDHFRMSVYKFV